MKKTLLSFSVFICSLVIGHIAEAQLPCQGGSLVNWADNYNISYCSACTVAGPQPPAQTVNVTPTETESICDGNASSDRGECVANVSTTASGHSGRIDGSVLCTDLMPLSGMPVCFAHMTCRNGTSRSCAGQSALLNVSGAKIGSGPLTNLEGMILCTGGGAPPRFESCN